MTAPPAARGSVRLRPCPAWRRALQGACAAAAVALLLTGPADRVFAQSPPEVETPAEQFERPAVPVEAPSDKDAEPDLAPAEIPDRPADEDLFEVFLQALEADRQLAAARSRRRAAAEDLPQARALFLPEITGSAGYEDERQDFGGQDLDSSGWDVALSLTQPVFRRESWVRLEQARTQTDAAELELELAEQQLALRVADAYFEVLLAQDEQALVEAELAAVESELQRARRALEVGTGTSTDVDEAQARYDRVSAERVATMNRLDVAREQLRRVTGRSPGRLAGLLDSFQPEPVRPDDPHHWVDLARRHNLEVRIAEQEDHLARHEIEANRADRWPDLDLEARLSRFDGERDQFGAGPGGQIGTTDDRIDTRTLRLQLTVPLYTGGAIGSRVRAAEAERTAAVDELADQRREGALTARSAFLTQRATRERVRALEQALRSARNNERSVRRGQEVGLRTTTDVLDAQQQRFQTKRDLAEARYDYLLNFLELQAAAGLTLGEAAIQDVNRQLESPDKTPFRE